MGKWAQKRYWIIGASEGLGRMLASQLAERGASLVVSARNRNRLASLAKDLGPCAQPLVCDVADSASVAAAAAGVGDIDGLIFASAVYEPIRAGKWDAAAVEAMCDVNFTGCARVLGAVMPHFLARKGGHIVLLGSLAGLRGLPGAIGYGASKAGLIHLGECLRVDLDPRHFRIQVINPGFIATRLTAKNRFPMPFIMSPEAAAHRVVRAMEGRAFRTDFPRRFALLFRLAGWLPDRLYFALARAMR